MFKQGPCACSKLTNGLLVKGKKEKAPFCMFVLFYTVNATTVAKSNQQHTGAKGGLGDANQDLTKLHRDPS